MNLFHDQNPISRYLGIILDIGRTFLGEIFKLRTLFWLILIALLLWAFREVSWGEVWGILERLNALQIFTLAGVDALVLWTFGMQLWVLLYARGYKISLLRLIAYWMAGFTFSYFTPGPQLAGAPVQIYFLQKNHPINMAQATDAVVASKLIERLGTILMLLLGVVLIAHLALFPALTIWVMLLFVLLFLGLLAAYLAAVYKNQRPLTRLLSMLPMRFRSWRGYRWFVDLVAAAERLMGENSSQHPSALLYAMLFTLLSWVLVVAETWLALVFLDIYVSLIDIIIIVTVAQLAFLFPTPAGVGAVEASLVFTFQRLGFSPNEGVSMALLFRARDLILGALGLVIGWWQSYPLDKTVDGLRSGDETSPEESVNSTSEIPQNQAYFSRKIEPGDRRSRDEYNFIAGIYDWLIEITAFLDGVQDERERERLVKHLELVGGESVLEVAFGTGENLPYLSESLGSRGVLVGIDLSRAMLEQASQKGQHLKIPVALVEANASGLPFASSCFDAILHFGGINHFSEKKIAINEILRVAKEGGRIVISDKSYWAIAEPSLRQRLIMWLKPWLAEPPPQELITTGSEPVRLEWFWNNTAYILSFRK